MKRCPNYPPALGEPSSNVVLCARNSGLGRTNEGDSGGFVGANGVIYAVSTHGYLLDARELIMGFANVLYYSEWIAHVIRNTECSVLQYSCRA